MRIKMVLIFWNNAAHFMEVHWEDTDSSNERKSFKDCETCTEQAGMINYKPGEKG